MKASRLDNNKSVSLTQKQNKKVKLPTNNIKESIDISDVNSIKKLVATGGEEIQLVYSDKQQMVTAYIIGKNGQSVLIKSQDVPKSLKSITSRKMFEAFLENAYAKISTLSNGDVKLYIEQRGLGGGKEDRETSYWKQMLGQIKDVASKQYEEKNATEMPQPKVFISYAWETDAVNLANLQRWLGGLRDDLQQSGMSVFLDIGDMSGSIEACMTENLSQSDIILTIHTARYNVRATDKGFNNLKFEYEKTLARAKINPKSVIPLHYSGSVEEAFGKNNADNELKSLKSLGIRDCTTPEAYSEQLVSTGTSNVKGNSFGLIPAIYDIVYGVDVSKDGDYQELVKHWRQEKLNYLPSIVPVTVERSELGELEEAFKTNTSQVISGVKGTGKSELALKYAKKHEKDYTIKRWLKAGDLEQEFKIIADELVLTDQGSEKSKKQDIVSSVYKYLEQVPSWLLIFDDAQDAASMSQYLPISLKEGQHILITSRNQEWTGKNNVALSNLNIEAGTKYLQLILPNISESKASELANMVKCLPQALRDAAIFIKRSGISVDKYLKTYQAAAPEYLESKLSADKAEVQKQQSSGLKAQKKDASPFGKALSKMKAIVEKQNNNAPVKVYISCTEEEIYLIEKQEKQIKEGKEALITKKEPVKYSEQERQAVNNKLQGWVKKLVSDLASVNITAVLPEGDDLATRAELIKNSEAIIVVNTPSYKKLATSAEVNILKEEYKLIIEKSREIPMGIFPLRYHGGFGDSVPSELGKYLVRDFTSESSYEGDLIAQNPLGIVPAIHKLDCDGNAEYKQTIKEWRWENLTKIPPLNPDFIGRQAVLQELASHFDKGSDALSQRQAVSATGGMGKSEVATTFANQNLSKYTMVRWLNTEGDGIKSEFDQIARELGIDPKGMELEQLVRVVHRNLLEIPSWLLIFDNADDERAIKAYLPKEVKPQHHILITSRSDHWECKHTGLDQFTQDDALEYIGNKFAGNEIKVDKAAALKLAEAVEYLPLALSQAVAYINQERISIAEYLADESTLFKANSASNSSTDEGQRYQHNIQTTWTKSIKKVAERSPEAAKILELAAYLSPDNMPTELFEQDSLLGNAAVVHKALIVLKDYSLIQTAKLDDCIRVHRLVQAVSRQQDQSKEAAANLITSKLIAVGEAIVKCYPIQKAKPTDYEQAKLLLPHVESLITGIEQNISRLNGTEKTGAVVEQIKLLNIAGNAYYDLGQYAASQEQYNKVLKLQEQYYTANDPEIVRTLNNLGNNAMMLGNYEQQKDLLTRAVEINIKAKKDDEGSKPNRVEVSTGDTKDANREAGNDNAVNKISTIEEAACLTNLGLAYYQLGNQDESFKNLKQALKLQYDGGYYQLNHPGAATTIEALANLQGTIGDYLGKKILLEESLRIKENYYGENHLQVANVLEELGEALTSLNKYEQAQKILQKSLEIKKSYYGDKHLQIANTLEYLSKALGVSGNHTQQEEMLNEALVIKKAYYGDKHSQVGFNLYQQSFLFEELKDYKKALEFVTNAYFMLTSCSYYNENLLKKYIARAQELELQVPGLSELNKQLFSLAKKRVSADEVQSLVGKIEKVNIIDSCGNTPLMWAALFGHTEVAKLLLEKGANLEDRNNEGNTPLMWAAYLSSIDVAKLLLEKGANLEAIDNDGKTPLMWAAQKGSTEVAKLLLEKGANLEAIDNEGKTVLHLAAICGEIKILELILSKDIIDINKADSNGDTPLHRAAYQGQLKSVELLINKGANSLLKNNEDQTPLELVRSNNDDAAAKDIVKTAAYLESKYSEMGIELVNKDKAVINSASVNNDLKESMQSTSKNGTQSVEKPANTKSELITLNTISNITTIINFLAITDITNVNHLLSLAAIKGSTEVAKLLLEKDANLEAIDNDGITPLMWAALFGHTEVAKLLLEKGANPEAIDNDGKTPLTRAAEKSHIEVAKLLLEKGANLEAKDNDGKTPLLRAAVEGRTEVAKLLLEKGANFEDRDNSGYTPLMWAALFGHTEVAKLLLEKGANLEDRDNDCYTPLMMAAWQGHIDLTTYLLGKGSNIIASSTDGKTALHLAAAAGQIEMLEFILSKDVIDINKTDSNGDTSLHRAAYRGKLKSVELLINKGANCLLKNNKNETPLDLAKTNDDDAAAEDIVKTAAYLESKTAALVEQIATDLPTASNDSDLQSLTNSEEANINDVSQQPSVIAELELQLMGEHV